MPEVGHDALVTHLFVPAHLASRHEWGFDVNTYAWAVMPMLGDWLFSIGYMLAGETAARLINVSFIFVLGWLVRDLVIWGGGSALGAKWAVLLFLTTPLTFTESSSLFIESVWASFVIAGSLSVFKILQRKNDQAAHLPMAGLLLGGALATKAVTFTILPVLLLILVCWYRTWVRWNLIPALMLGLILFFAAGAIPYATAWHLTGNPVFPFFNQIFQSPFWPAIAFDPPAVFGKGLTWDVLYQATFHTEKFLESRPGATGFQWLLLLFPALLILLFSRRHKGVILFIVAGLSVVLTFQSTAYLRYVFPSFAWVAGGIGVALSVAHTASVSYGRALGRTLSIIGWIVLFLNLVFLKSGTYYGDLSLQPLISQIGRETYLNSRLPIRNAVELVNRLNVARTPVAVFSSPLTAGLNSDGLYPNWYNHQFEAKVSQATTSEAIDQLLLEKWVDYVILDDDWGTAEKRKIIESATEKLAQLGVISVRKLKSNHQFKTELLKNPDFSTLEGWTLPPGTHVQPSRRVVVNVSSPAYQVISVVSGRHYRNSATAICADQFTQGRVQVNWFDSKSNFISTDIRVFDCTPSEAAHIMDVTAPRGASTASVYATGHTSIPIIFSEVSFKQ
jgi:4-amino-4-deoxy-L-arabinose transferase-like glycosyltransferase